MIVEVKNLFKTYQLGETKIEALRGLNLSLEAGEFTALIGASGSGKSTLLNLIGCLDRPDQGEVIIAGQNTSTLSEDQLSEIRNLRIGYIFQAFNLIPVLSVFENVELPLVLRTDITAAQRKERVLRALDDVGLGTFVNHWPNKLSGGQRQRVAIARALVTEPSLILADEPTANLDSKTANMIIDLLLEMNKKRNVTFLFCSHDEKLINRVQKIIRISDGKLV
ncbi:MAG: ABC transporter ATP-binding protein [Bdellovibrionaceae bacterium]|nr:ABC transporter ATP-binding protein [Pseudobdellovibrionaceae bacterium]